MKLNRIKSLAFVAMLFTAICSMAQDQWAMHTTDTSGGASFIAETARVLVLTNNVNITNIVLNGSTGTNATGTVYTNAAGRRITTTASTGTNVNLLTSVSLWALKDGGVPLTGTNLISSFATINPAGYANISLTVEAGAGAAAALTLIFAPVWDGVNVDTSGNSDFTWAFTPTASATKTIATNAPLYKWIGAKAVALKSITSADSATTKAAVIRAVSLNGFGPPK